MAAVPQKIILRSNTGVSLNDRFTKINQISSDEVRIQVAANRQASAKERRFAQQMANRPLIVPGIIRQPQQQQVVQQRTSALLRLGTPRRGRGSGRPFRGGYRGGRGGMSRGSGRGGAVMPMQQYDQEEVVDGSIQFQRGRSFVRGRGRGWRGRGGRGGAGVQSYPTGFRGGRGRGGFRGRGRGQPGGGQGQTDAQELIPGGRGRGRFQRGGGRGFQQRGRRGRGRAPSRRGGQSQLPPMTREQLDHQLDDYMSRSRNDADVDMAVM